MVNWFECEKEIGGTAIARCSNCTFLTLLRIYRLHIFGTVNIIWEKGKHGQITYIVFQFFFYYRNVRSSWSGFFLFSSLERVHLFVRQSVWKSVASFIFLWLTYYYECMALYILVLWLLMAMLLLSLFFFSYPYHKIYDHYCYFSSFGYCHGCFE